MKKATHSDSREGGFFFDPQQTSSRLERLNSQTIARREFTPASPTGGLFNQRLMSLWLKSFINNSCLLWHSFNKQFHIQIMKTFSNPLAHKDKN